MLALELIGNKRSQVLLGHIVGPGQILRLVQRKKEALLDQNERNVMVILGRRGEFGRGERNHASGSYSALRSAWECSI